MADLQVLLGWTRASDNRRDELDLYLQEVETEAGESKVGMAKTTNSVGTSKEILLRNGLRVPVQYLCNLPVKMHQDQFCYCW